MPDPCFFFKYHCNEMSRALKVRKRSVMENNKHYLTIYPGFVTFTVP